MSYFSNVRVEILPAEAWHRIEQYANNQIEIGHTQAISSTTLRGIVRAGPGRHDAVVVDCY
ncbi:MAG: hypothetical protein ACRDS9_01050 [Pseudonocardiaceae bacterium]